VALSRRGLITLWVLNAYTLFEGVGVRMEIVRSELGTSLTRLCFSGLHNLTVGVALALIQRV